MTTLSLAQAHAQWQELAASIPQNDTVMLSESWNDYTDSLCKDGAITSLQYDHAPSYDEPMPEASRWDDLAGDLEMVLDGMRVSLKSTRVDARPNADNFDAGASHWRCTLRHGSQRMQVFYSMGSAHTGMPEREDVLHSLLMDSEYADGTFADFCDALGLDEDSRKAYRTFRACKRVATSLRRLFSPDELEDLRELTQNR